MKRIKPQINTLKRGEFAQEPASATSTVCETSTMILQ